MADDIVYDEMLGELRTSDVSGGTGGSSFEPVGGAGITVAGGTFSLALSTVRDILTGTPVIKAIDVAALRGALTAGQAVDVTSQPDGVMGDYKGTFSVTGSLGFASFPKYASGLNYLMIADLTATTSGTVTPSGTWLDGTTTAKNLAAGTSTRVAMLFNAANKAKLTFASTGSVSVTNCREYEITACSTEAVAYIAQLASPDAFASYYLVKPDMVQPWTYIIDMGSSPAVTIASGLSYKLNATTGVYNLTVDTCPAGYDGRDAIIRITLGGSGVIQAIPPLQLGGALIPYAVNNCTVRFRDGEAVLLVEDTLAGYVVTLTSGTGEGSLPYGLAASSVPYIAFSPSTDGIPIDLSGATTAAEEVTVVGNGYTSTTLTGSINCTSKTTVANLGLQDVVVNGGVMTLGDAFIPSGSTVAVSGGGLAVEKVTGNGGVIDLGGTNIKNGGTPLFASGVSFTGGLADRGGAIRATGKVDLVDCVISGNTCTEGGAAVFIYYTNNIAVNLTGCTVTGNTGTNTLSVVGTSAGYNLSSCHIGENQDIRLVSATDYTTFAGSNTFLANFSGSGTVTLTSGAILDLTGNSNATPIAPGGGITFEQGGATVYPSAGQASAYELGGITIPQLHNTNVINTGAAKVTIASGDTAYMQKCEISGNTSITPFTVSSGGSLVLSSCTITNNGGGTTATNYPVFRIEGTVSVKNCSGEFGESAKNQNFVMNSGVLTFENSEMLQGSIQMQNSATSVEIKGNCSFRRIVGSNLTSSGGGNVTISSGAVVTLVYSINTGGTIEVLVGGCTVNGVAVESGTYTSIVSSGGSAVINQ